MTDAEITLLHGSCVAIGGKAVLVTGRSGVGKSDLCFRLIDRGAMLVSDDQTRLVRSGEQLLASAPASILGKLEVRGLGILDMDYVENIPLALVIRLGAGVERFPMQAEMIDIAGLAFPQVALAGLEASAPLKVERALAGIAQ